MIYRPNQKLKKVDPSEYMVEGWDRQGTPSYRRGSLHNKVGMTIMWTYYAFFVAMVIRLIVVLNSN